MTECEYEMLDENACRELLGSAHVGRVALSVRAMPIILAVTFVLDGDSVVFRPVSRPPFGGTRAGVVAFETGQVDCARGFWSVMAIGIAEEVLDPSERMRLTAHRAHPSLSSDGKQLFRLPLQVVSGTRLVEGIGPPAV